MFTREEKWDAIKRPHAFAFSHHRGEYGHVEVSICIDDDALYRREYLKVHSQIGHGYEVDMVRRDILNPEERIYAQRLESDTRDGLTTAVLKRLLKIVTAFEKSEPHYKGFAQFCIAAVHAARARWVFLQPDNEKGHGVNKEDCEMLDMRNPADILRFAKWIETRRDQVWERVTPAHTRIAAQRQLDEEQQQPA